MPYLLGGKQEDEASLCVLDSGLKAESSKAAGFAAPSLTIGLKHSLLVEA
jgi:hypothetical protein